MSQQEARIGVIGGSGLYDIPEIDKRGEVTLETPFGRPSGPYRLGVLEGVEVAFLARHGAGHTLLPSEINYRANIHGFKQLGVERIVSLSAVGSLREDIHPRDIVFPDQYYDRTKNRESTFFGGGCAAHVSFAHPVCPEGLAALVEAAGELGLPHHQGGTYVCMEGPAFSTLAESLSYRQLGAAVIGMTNLTEAKLAREAELCYNTIALVTDYDCWHEEEEAVTVEAVLDNLRANAEAARRLLRAVIGRLPRDRTACSCGRALEHALITAPEAISAEARQRLALLLAPYLTIGGDA